MKNNLLICALGLSLFITESCSTTNNDAVHKANTDDVYVRKDDIKAPVYRQKVVAMSPIQHFSDSLENSKKNQTQVSYGNSNVINNGNFGYTNFGSPYCTNACYGGYNNYNYCGGGYNSYGMGYSNMFYNPWGYSHYGYGNGWGNGFNWNNTNWNSGSGNNTTTNNVLTVRKHRDDLSTPQPGQNGGRNAFDQNSNKMVQQQQTVNPNVQTNSNQQTQPNTPPQQRNSFWNWTQDNSQQNQNSNSNQNNSYQQQSPWGNQSGGSNRQPMNSNSGNSNGGSNWNSGGRSGGGGGGGNSGGGSIRKPR